MSINKFIIEYSHIYPFACCLCLLSCYSDRLITPPTWNAKPKVFTISFLVKRFANSLTKVPYYLFSDFPHSFTIYKI